MLRSVGRVQIEAKTYSAERRMPWWNWAKLNYAFGDRVHVVILSGRVPFKRRGWFVCLDRSVSRA